MLLYDERTRVLLHIMTVDRQDWETSIFSSPGVHPAGGTLTRRPRVHNVKTVHRPRVRKKLVCQKQKYSPTAAF